MRTQIILTGALGLVGSEILRRLLKWDSDSDSNRRSDSEIIVLIRSKGSLSAEERFNRLWPTLFETHELDSSYRKRIRVFESQLHESKFGLSSEIYDSLSTTVTDIFHFASELRFDLTLEEARLANVKSTENLIEFAKKACTSGNFKHFHYLSTYAVSRSDPSGTAFESPPQLFESYRNTYEQTKAESEMLLLANSGEVPCSIYRPSVIGGHSKTGWTSKFDTFYLPIQFFLSGGFHHLSILPVSKNGKLDTVTIDFVADALYVLYRQSRNRISGQIFHLTAGIASTPIGQTLKNIFNFFNVSQGLPEIVEIDSFCADDAQSFLKTLSVQGTDYLNIFKKILPYVFDSCIFDHSRLLDELKDSSIVPRGAHESLFVLIDYAIRTEWGKHPGARPPLSARPLMRQTTDSQLPSQTEEPIAVIGIGGVLPGAMNVSEFLALLRENRCALSEVPIERWNPDIFYDPDPGAPNKTSSKLGGFIRSFEFDEKKFRIPPITAKSMDRLQKLVLLAAEEAWQDAHTSTCTRAHTSAHANTHASAATDAKIRDGANPAIAEKTGMILGHDSGLLENDSHSNRRIAWEEFQPHLKEILLKKISDHQVVLRNQENNQPSERELFVHEWIDSLEQSLVGDLPLMNEDTLAGSLANVAVGRVMNYFDLKGISYVVNAGDSSALAAIDQAVDSLRSRESDCMIAGGAHAHLGPMRWICASQERGSDEANGPDETSLGEGVALFILKRLSDAIRDQNKIYSVIRGVHSQNCNSVGTLVPQIGNLGGASGAALFLKAVLSLYYSKINSITQHPRQLKVSSEGHWDQSYSLIVEEWNPIQYPLQLEFKPVPEVNPCPIAVVGMGSVLPGAADVDEYWNLILSGRDSIREFPKTARPEAGKAIPKGLGAFAPSCEIDLIHFGISSQLSEELDPIHSKFLASAQQAIKSLSHSATPSAAHSSDPFDAPLPATLPQKTSLVVGESKGCSIAYRNLLLQETWIMLSPLLDQTFMNSMQSRLGWSQADLSDIKDQFKSKLKALENPIHSETPANLVLLSSVAKVARSYGIQGGHCTIDAACASSLAALNAAVRELRLRKQDCIIWGGVGMSVTPQSNIPFEKCEALSNKGSHPFDETADGIVLGEGSTVFILKRLETAVQDQDKIHSLILGTGGSSDGRGHSMMAPSTAGQASAMKKALTQALCSPDEIQWIECHATGTRVGDASEWLAVQEVYQRHSQSPDLLRVGSVKSQIGHTIGAAGAAGVLKAILGLKHQIFPPMKIKTRIHPHLQMQIQPHVETSAEMKPQELSTQDVHDLRDSRNSRNSRNPTKALDSLRKIKVQTQPEHWNPNVQGLPRRASVSAFGFGGTNWHAILEEAPECVTEGLVENTLEHTKRLTRLKTSAPYAFLFPGHGSTYPKMGLPFYNQFPVFRAAFREANDVLLPLLGLTLEQMIYTSPPNEVETHLLRTDRVQPIILALNIGYYRVLRDLGLKPAVLLGHSIGEISAAVASGMISFEEGLTVSHARGKIFRDFQKLGTDTGSMVAVFTSASQIDHILRELNLSTVQLATINSPHQCSVSGDSQSIQIFMNALTRAKIAFVSLPVTVAWHSSAAFQTGHTSARALFSQLDIREPRTRILNNLQATDYGSKGFSEGHLSEAHLKEQVVESWTQQLGSPMNWINNIEKLYSDGIQTFVEVGSKSSLTHFVSEILEDRPHRVFSVDSKSNIEPVAHIRNISNELSLVHSQAGSLAAVSPSLSVVCQKMVLGPRSLHSLANPSRPNHFSGSRLQNEYLDHSSSATTPTASITSTTSTASTAFKTTLAQDYVKPEARLPLPRNENEIYELLLKSVQDKTGYPREMLSLDADLEGDLGIDSIKQVQIVSQLRKFYPDMQFPMQLRIKDFPTLRHWVSLLMTQPLATQKSDKSISSPLPFSDSIQSTLRLKRYEMDWHLAQPSESIFSSQPFFPYKKICVILGDLPIETMSGFTSNSNNANNPNNSNNSNSSSELDAIQPLLQFFRENDADVQLISMKDNSPWIDISTDLILHFGALSRLEDPMSVLKSYLRIAQTFPAQLKRWVAIHGGAGPEEKAVDGAVCGFMRTFAQEYPLVQTQILSVNPSEWGKELSEFQDVSLSSFSRWIEELTCSFDGHSSLGSARESSISRNQTKIPGFREAALDLNKTPSLTLERGSVIVFSGGLGGLGFEISKDLASLFQPTFVYLTRTQQTDEKLDSTHLYSAVNSAVSSAVSELEKLGSQVYVRTCDVTDSNQVQNLTEWLSQKFGSIAGVIHAAGILNDCKISTKNESSFQEVYQVKVKGMENLSNLALRLSSRFFSVFSSISAIEGNYSQCDYAAANGAMTSMITQLRSQAPQMRSFAIAWGPWAKVGMVANLKLETLFENAGRGLIQPNDGVLAFRNELFYGQPIYSHPIDGRQNNLVIYQQEPHSIPFSKRLFNQPIASNPARSLNENFYFIDQIHSHVTGSFLSISRTFEPDPVQDPKDRWLNDHQLGGLVIFPATFAIELFAQVVLELCPSFILKEMNHFKIHQPVFIRNEQSTRLRVEAFEYATAQPTQREVHVYLFVDPSPEIQIEAKWIVSSLGASESSQRPVHLISETIGSSPSTSSISIYQMHEGSKGSIPLGPFFHVLSQFGAESENVSVGKISPILPSLFQTYSRPFEREAAFHCAALSKINRDDGHPIPSRIGSMRFYTRQSYPPRNDPSQERKVQISLESHSHSHSHSHSGWVKSLDRGDQTFDLFILDPEGNVDLEILDYKTIDLRDLSSNWSTNES